MSSNNPEQQASATLARAMAVLEAFGADPARWPAAERDAVLGALGARPELARQQADDATLDRLMDAAPVHAAAPALKSRILAAANAEQGGRVQGWLAALWPFGPPWQPASALAAAALLGLIAGATLPGGYGDDDYGLAAFDLIADADLLP